MDASLAISPASILRNGNDQKLTPPPHGPIQRKYAGRVAAATHVSIPGLTHPNRISDIFLSDLLDRVLQVEKKCSRLITATDKGGTPSESITLARDDIHSHSNTPSLTSTQHPRTEIVTPSTGPKTDAESVSEESELCSTPKFSAEILNADARLNQAIDQVLHLKRQSLDKQTASMDYHVPPELSKACLDSETLPFNFQIGV